jgi:hypothetical protein
MIGSESRAAQGLVYSRAQTLVIVSAEQATRVSASFVALLSEAENNAFCKAGLPSWMEVVCVMQYGGSTSKGVNPGVWYRQVPTGTT